VNRLLGWDGVAAADSAAALNFWFWRSGMAGILQQPGFEALQSLPWTNEDFTPEFAAAILDQAVTAAGIMVDQFGDTDVPMGQVFRIGNSEQSWPLGGETIAAEATIACLAQMNPLCDRTQRAFASAHADDRNQRRATRGSNSMRLVEFAQPLRSWSLHVYGQSDDADSPHHDDQAALMSRREFKPVWFNRDELEGHIESTLVLEIGE
jgi:acyl-homoserine-lactone acylase